MRGHTLNNALDMLPHKVVWGLLYQENETFNICFLESA